MMANKVGNIDSLDKTFSILIGKAFVQLCLMVVFLVLYVNFTHVITCTLLVIEGLHILYTIIRIEKIDKRMDQEFERIYRLNIDKPKFI